MTAQHGDVEGQQLVVVAALGSWRLGVAPMQISLEEGAAAYHF
jgi:hypothetical protein